MKSFKFPIVALGSSAGGLEALTKFFAHTPDDMDMAFVVFQHMSDTHESLMDGLLQRHTSMETAAAKDGEQVEPRRIYLNSPGKTLVVENRILRTESVQNANAAYMPIDRLFRSLAESERERSVCIILSGTGTDGTLGLKAVKEAGGLVMAQEITQAAFPGMPKSALDTGLVDITAEAEKLPGHLVDYVHRLFKTEHRPDPDGKTFDRCAGQIFSRLKSLTGNDFSGYKPSTVRRRIERRMAIHQCDEIESYLKRLLETHEEAEALFQDFLIGVTRFFRDPDAFDALGEAVSTKLIAYKNPEASLRIWAPGCATGEEAYSIAILVFEILEQQNAHMDVQIFATDLDKRAVEFARIGTYPENIAADMSPERLNRFFVKDEKRRRIKKQIRDMVVFAEHNVLKDPPFANVDIISCRNLLIYLNSGVQKKLIPLFHYALLPEGLLFLGSAENIGEFTDLFAPVNIRWKIFSRIPGKTIGKYELPPPFSSGPVRKETSNPVKPMTDIDLYRVAEKIVMENYAPPSVLINNKGEIRYFIGPTDHFFKPPTGKPSFNLIQMAHESFRRPLSSAIEQASQEKKTVITEPIQFFRNSTLKNVTVIVRPLIKSMITPGHMIVVFQETGESAGRRLVIDSKRNEREDLDVRIISLEQQLRSKEEELDIAVEELETSNEELKSANEELQSVNEELQSANEELQTSKEEVDSTNEELVTVNAELQDKVDALSRSNNDINNLMAAADLEVLFLDNLLCVKRFTPAVREIFNLIDSDIGRPITDITANMEYEHLETDIKTVLDTLNTREAEICTKTGEWRAMRIMPYRTLDNVIEGAALTFSNITILKQMEIDAVNARSYAESIVETIRDALVVLDNEFRIKSANKAFYTKFAPGKKSIEGRPFFKFDGGRWDIPKLKALLENILPEDKSFSGFEIDHADQDGRKQKLLLNARMIEQQGDQPKLILLVIEEIRRD